MLTYCLSFRCKYSQQFSFLCYNLFRNLIYKTTFHFLRPTCNRSFLLNKKRTL
ncbi:hypothetical protein TPELBph1_CDS0024 [Terrisporobacter phage TPELB_ph1]